MKIIFNCVCGNRHELLLQEGRNLYTVGSLEPDNSLNLCRDDLHALSRRQCHFKRVNGRWHLFDGCPSEYPLPSGKTSRASACGTFLTRRGKLIKVSCAEGLPLEPGDQINFVPTKIPILFQGEIVVPRAGFLYTGVAVEPLPPIGDVDALVKELLRGKQVDQIEPAPEEVREQFGELYELTHKITACIGDTTKTLEMTLQFTREKIPASTAVAILLLQPDGETFKPLIGHEQWKPEFRFSKTIVSMVVKTKRPVVSKNISEMIAFQNFLKQQKSDWIEKGQVRKVASFGDSIGKLHIESVIVIPLLEKEKIIGLFWLDNRKGNSPFTEIDFYLATAIATLIQLQLIYDKRRVDKID